MFSSIAPDDAPSDSSLPAEAVGSAYKLASLLMDSLLHDARNPLNALSINLEVVSEKLRKDEELRAAVEKNLKAMREQIFRVDAILKRFSDFIAPKPRPCARINVSNVVQKAVDTLGHESRKRRIRFSSTAEPDLEIACRDASEVHLALIEPMLFALEQTAAGEPLTIHLNREGENVLLRIQGPMGNGGANAPRIDAWNSLCRNNGLALLVSDGLIEISGAAG